MDVEEEEERKTKLQAGKDALLAYQKKKKLKKKKPKDSILADESNTLHSNESSLLDSTSHDDIDHPTNHSSLNSGHNHVQLNSDHTHNTHTSLTTSTSELNQLVVKLKEDNRLLSLELANVKQDYEGATMSSLHYKTELGSLQRRVMTLEEELSSKRRELDETRTSFDVKMNGILEEKESEYLESLNEEREKHLQHVARLTEELQQTPPTLVDEGEMEAQRIKQLKSKLQEIYEKEKESLLLSNQKEKDLMREEFEKEKENLNEDFKKTLDKNRQELEALANEQIRQFHSQYVTAHTSLTEEKQKVELELSQVHVQYQQLKDQVGNLEKEKREVSQQLSQLQELHSDQLKAVENNSLDLKKQMQDWCNKAAGLEVRLQQTTVDHTERLLAKEDALRELQSKYEEEILNHNETVKGLEKKQESLESDLAQSQSQFERLSQEKHDSLKQLETQLSEAHRKELRELQEKHDHELSEIKRSIATSPSEENENGSEGTLHFAVKHMTEIQQQLNAYRNQEVSHKTALDNLEHEHKETITMLKEEYDQKLSTLNQQVEANQTTIESSQQIIDELKRNKEELQQSLTDIETQKDQLEEDHKRTVSDIKARHENEIEELKTNLEMLHQTQLEQEKETILSNKETELATVTEKNRLELHNLRESLSSTSQEEIGAAKLEIIELKKKIQEYEPIVQESLRYQELAEKSDADLKASNASLNLVKMELERLHDTSQQEIDTLTTTKTKLEGQIDDLARERDELNETFEVTLQEKEDELATHVSRIKTLQMREKELTQELDEERSTHATNELQKLSTVHAQLTEAKQRYSTLMKEWSQKEDSFKTKLEEQKLVWSSRQKEWNEESEQLTQKVATLQHELERKNSELIESETKSNELSIQSRESILNLENSLEAANKRVLELSQANKTLQQSKTLLEQQVVELKNQIRDLQQQICSLQEKLPSEEQSLLITDLQDKLEARELATMELQKEFEQKLTEAETKRLSLQKKMAAMQRVESRLGSLVNERGGLEKSLARSRQTLIEKLREKEIIEKDLTYHRTELERRLMEKQRLEELLFEKNRYEKELHQQKQQLSNDLEKIEKKLQSNEIDFSSEHSNNVSYGSDNKVEVNFESTHN